MLDHDGQAVSQTIVNRIYDQVDHDADLIVDHGNYLQIENMTGNEKPTLLDNRVIWDSSILERGSLYYQGTVEKQLPVEISIIYYLDGIEVKPGDLAGKSGNLEIAIKFTNTLQYEQPLSYYDYEGNLTHKDDVNYVPMVVQGSIELDLARFSDIEPGDGTSMVMGQNVSINFMVFPYPEEELRFSMNGKDIELERFSFMVMPQMPPINNLDIESILNQMLEGIETFDQIFGELSTGAEEIEKGLILFRDESRKMTAGFDDYQVMINDYQSQRDNLTDLMKTADSELLAESLNNLLSLMETIDNMPDSNDMSGEIAAISAESQELGSRIKRLEEELQELNRHSDTIQKEAEKLVSDNEPGSPLYEMGLILIMREKLLQDVIEENTLAEANLSRLQSSVDSLQNQWLNQYLPGIEAIESISELEGSDNLIDQLSGIIENLDSFEDYLAQVDAFISEAEVMAGDLSKLPGALGQLAEGQSELTKGLNLLRSGGITAMKDELIDGINESRAGQAKLELMEKLADDYRSYADNENNRHSEVRFIMQTPRVEIEPDQEDHNGQDEEESRPWNEVLWYKIINLFE
jgi:conjugal transfer/entry exclusion protein